MQSRYFFSVTGCLSVICFLVAFYVAAEHTVHFFANHNYFFSPFADDILDNSITTYPIALGKRTIWKIFSPYIDHRVAIEHIQELIDFTLTHGVQILQPYRISILLWLNFCVFFRYVIQASSLTKAVKLFLGGAYLFLLFPGMSVNNYVSTMQITWPIIFLFALFTFVNLASYCKQIKENADSKKTVVYFILTILCLNVALYTFNIGSILWPIVFLILISQRCFKKQGLFWIGAVIINYYFYLDYQWVMSNVHFYMNHAGSSSLMQGFSAIFNLYSRIITVPFDIRTFYLSTWFSQSIGLISILISLLFIAHFLMKKNASSFEVIFFGYFVFSMFTTIVISMMRIDVAWRFLTGGLLYDFCLIMALFLMAYDFLRLHRWVSVILVFAGTGWLLFGFLPMDKFFSNGVYELGFFNQVFISEATQIPINDHFLKASKIYQTSGELAPHVYINTINQSQHKGPYSFWVSQYMNQPIRVLQANKQVLKEKSTIYIAYDYRPEQSPGLLINVQVEDNHTPMNNQWQIVFTRKDGTIVGFGISAPNLQPLWALLIRPSHLILWRGAINTESLKPNDIVYAWAVLQTQNVIYQLGSMTIPAPLYSQKEASWEWQRTQHFGNLSSERREESAKIR